MRFFDEDLSTSQLVRGFLIALAGSVALVPTGVVLFAIRPVSLHPAYLIGSAAAFCVVGVVMAIQVRVFKATGRRDHWLISPPAVFVLAMLAMSATGFVQLAAGGSAHLYLPLLLLTTVYIAIAGDRVMQAAGWVAASAVTVWVLAESGVRGRTFWSEAIIWVTVFALVQVMVAMMSSSLSGKVRTRVELNAIAELEAETRSIGEVLSDCVPIVASLLPLEHMTALVGSGASGRVLMSWPEPGQGFTSLAEEEAYDQCVARGKPVLSGNRYFLPAGYVPGGIVVLVLELAAMKWRSMMATEETVRELMPRLLQLTGRVSHFAHIREESRTDELTGLPNRRAFFDRLDAEIHRAQRWSSPLCVAILDIDFFKDYNDAFGHLEGDHALRLIGQVLHSRLRGEDLIARYGGEEFCAVLPNTDVGRAAGILEELREKVALLDLRRPTTISAGVAEWDSGEASSRLLGRADEALYEAKSTGRNRVITAAPAAAA